MNAPPEIVQFYRLVATDPPTLSDFLSAAMNGRRLPETPEEDRLYTGISVYATETQARTRLHRV